MGAWSSVILGATGLTGSNLMRILATKNQFKSIDVLVRRNINAPFRVTQHITAFREYDFKHYPDADVVFCCIGTTIKKAGNQANFEQVDFELPLKIAKYYKNVGASTFVLQSSVGASAQSNNFYLKVKGKLEDSLEQLGFERLIIARPSLLLGARSESRPGERLGKFFAPIMNFFMRGNLQKYKAIRAEKVAKAMVEAAIKLPKGKHILEWNEMDELVTK
jgi:uncharacterized protein YbjT (DUF2867 family)